MPLTDEQKAAVEVLKGVAEADIDEAAELVKSSAQPIYQKIFRGGHSTATNAAKGEKKTLSDELAAEKERAAALEKEAAELREKQPDVAKLNEQWQAKLDAEKKKGKEALEAERQQTTAEREARKLSDLKAALGNLDPDYADIKARGVVNRLRHDDKGELQLFEAGTEIPVQLEAGKTAVGALAEEIEKAADAKWIRSNADSGSGTERPGGAGTKKTDEDFRKATEETADYVI